MLIFILLAVLVFYEVVYMNNGIILETTRDSFFNLYGWIKGINLSDLVSRLINTVYERLSHGIGTDY